MTNPKPGRGGRRPGAGAPKRPSHLKRSSTTFTITPAERVHFRAQLDRIRKQEIHMPLIEAIPDTTEIPVVQDRRLIEQRERPVIAVVVRGGCVTAVMSNMDPSQVETVLIDLDVDEDEQMIEVESVDWMHQIL